MGCTPNSFQQFLLQGKTTIKRHVICSLFVVSTLWGRKTIFIPGLRAKVHGCFYLSHGLEAISLLFLGEIKQATAILNPEWLLFFPSIYGFATFDSYINTVENNKLYDKEQRFYFKENYQSSSFKVLKGQKVKS